MISIHPLLWFLSETFSVRSCFEHLLSSSWQNFKRVEGQRCGRAGWQSTSPGVGSWKFVLDPGSSLFTGFLVSCSLCHMRLLSGTPSFLPSLHRWQAYKTVRQNKHIHLRWFLSAILVTATQKASDTCNQIPCQTTANKAAISPMHSGECSG